MPRPSEGDREFLSRIEDIFAVSRNRNIAKFSHFLDERQAYLAKMYAQRQEQPYLFYGGYENAERVMLGVFPDYLPPSEEAFPLSPVTVTFRREDALSHRDFLGSLMALKIKREMVGDILPEPGRCVLFLGEAAAPLVFSELKKIGRVGVKLFPGIIGELPPGKTLVPVEGTVSSLRLDAVTAMVTGLSREKAQALIRSGEVTINYAAEQSVSAPLAPEDILRIRGYGKFLITGEMRTTKKDRIYLILQKYV